MQHQATIAAIQQVTPSIKTFTLDCGNQKFNFHPGQWVDIHLTIDDETHNCGYSITSIPYESNTIEIAVKLAPELLLTEYLHNKSKVGDRIFISDAKGDVWVNGNIEGPYVFIGGGVGITPLFSMITHIANNKPETPMVLLYSIISTEEYLFKDRLSELERTLPNFMCHATITRAKEHDEEFSGRINGNTLKAIKLPKNATYYLCGPPSMVDSVAEQLKQLKDELKLDLKNIYYDKWWA